MDMLVLDHAFLVATVVRNNPRGVADVLLMKGLPDVQQLTALVMAMDADEQAETLAAVPYIKGNDPVLDAALTAMFGIMQEHGGDGLQHVDGVGTQKFVMAAIMGVAGLVSGFTNMEAGKEVQAQAGIAAGQAIYENAYATAKAEQAAQEQAALIKKWTPWAIGGLALVAIIIYIIAHR